MRNNKIATLLITGLLAWATCAQGSQPAPQQAQSQTPAQMKSKAPTSMRFGPANTPGWSLMTPQERAEHRSKMMGFTNYEDCSSYLAEHHAMMLERARKKGVTLPANPRQDFCQRLPRKGASN